MKINTTLIKKFILIPCLLYLLFFAGIVIFQRHFLYFPNDRYHTPQEEGYDHFKEISVKTEDGIALKGWYSPATKKKKTIVFFHGNADSLRRMARISLPYTKAGYGFVLTEYRGFSGFEGFPNEEGLYNDARAFVNEIIKQGAQEKEIVFWGHSMGTGVATQMATEFPSASGLMLLAPYTSIPDMAEVRFPFFPAKYFVWDRFLNREKIPTLKMPVLITHGTADIVIPFWQGHVLYELAHEPKEMHYVSNGGHNNLFEKPFAAISLRWLGKIR